MACNTGESKMEMGGEKMPQRDRKREYPLMYGHPEDDASP